MPNGMPPLETMNNDEAFLSLLSSQRELLNQLNMESAIRREQQARGHLPPRKRGSILGVDPLSLMNRPIIERRASLDLLFSRRLSLGMGIDNFMTPPMNDEHSLKDVKGDMDLGSYHSKKMKRRRSSLLLLLGAMLFDEPQQSRRFSLISSLYKPMDNDDDRLDQVLLSFENTELAYKKPKMNHNVDPNTLKSTMQGFATAMEKSTKSQQEIHDWDRKMGLKRSHSKTMRMSMRSRKKLRTLVKKEINALVVSRNMRFQFPSRVLKRRLAKKPWEKSNRILFLFTANMPGYW
jgi:hypothetical protein